MTHPRETLLLSSGVLDVVGSEVFVGAAQKTHDWIVSEFGQILAGVGLNE